MNVNEDDIERLRELADDDWGLSFDYVGELIDPEQTPLTLSVFACKACGALVIGATERTHFTACTARAR